jgi:2-polyprenyl-3-methyl-5-hydroxy-6-metoxy-1,4-benzoquinol methylase
VAVPVVTPAALDYAVAFDPDADFDRHYAHATARRVAPWLRPADRVLELGCASGLMTAALAPRAAAIHAVDRSAAFLATAHSRQLPNATFEQALVEELQPSERYEQIVAAALLNELEDPVALLRAARGWLAPGGLLHVTMVNPRSLHRLLALEMGLIETLEEPSERGAAYDAGRIADAAGLEALGAAAGLRCLHREAVFLKPFTNAQLSALPDELLSALDRLARRFPEHGALTYAVFAEDTIDVD